jgi:hypothetical protein
MFLGASLANRRGSGDDARTCDTLALRLPVSGSYVGRLCHQTLPFTSVCGKQYTLSAPWEALARGGLPSKLQHTHAILFSVGWKAIPVTAADPLLLHWPQRACEEWPDAPIA